MTIVQCTVKISFWETKNLEINDQILKRHYELELAKSEMLKFDQKEKQLTAELKLARDKNIAIFFSFCVTFDKKFSINNQKSDKNVFLNFFLYLLIENDNF